LPVNCAPLWVTVWRLSAGSDQENIVVLESLQKIRIVLIATTHPGNVGATARAMCNMGLANLYLVRPERYPHADAEARAAGAVHILRGATIVQSLDEALAGCSLVVGTSARERRIPWPVLPARQAVEQVIQEASEPGSGDIAILFGREEHGLTNDELQRCNLHLTIPSNPDYSSLNLAMAVQLIAYELRVAALEGMTLSATEKWDQPWADAQTIEHMLHQLEEVLVATTFLDPQNPRQVMTRLRRMFARNRLDKIEVGILRGMLAFILQRLKP
jgi:tRNA (cytidine32/uridine32-2'-O)-methyltransferase